MAGPHLEIGVLEGLGGGGAVLGVPSRAGRAAGASPSDGCPMVALVEVGGD